jgi:uncharacterized flavoprotein (TIGR03862 family)
MKKSVAIIGSGPAAMMLAASLDEKQFDIVLYEKNQTAGRKFLVAGKGGFNLTHSEDSAIFFSRYTPASFFKPLLNIFSNTQFINWLASIGIPTYVGTSKRIFPARGIKPIQVLNAILNMLEKKKVKFLFSHQWTGWTSKKELIFSHRDNIVTLPADIVVFALGGNSWKITGSDGAWASPFELKGIRIVSFEPSNCAFGIHWPKALLETTEGMALKNIHLSCGDVSKAGEVIITAFGLEGSGIYALSPQIRAALKQYGHASVVIDLKPALSREEVALRLMNRRANRSLSKWLEEGLNLDATKIAVLKNLLSKEEYLNPIQLAEKIKSLPVRIHALSPIDEAISTVGGISLDEIDSHFQLKKMPGTYVIGEMLDWDGPTGGYLLQACFSMGYALARHLNQNEAT